ncbi:MAG: hypothetical protein HFH85_01495 [Lachnospiraceae bacterium]|nr:hypothetical protein [Lachnospiraceae bacterium]
MRQRRSVREEKEGIRKKERSGREAEEKCKGREGRYKEKGAEEKRKGRGAG